MGLLGRSGSVHCPEEQTANYATWCAVRLSLLAAAGIFLFSLLMYNLKFVYSVTVFYPSYQYIEKKQVI